MYWSAWKLKSFCVVSLILSHCTGENNPLGSSMKKMTKPWYLSFCHFFMDEPIHTGAWPKSQGFVLYVYLHFAGHIWGRLQGRRSSALICNPLHCLQTQRTMEKMAWDFGRAPVCIGSFSPVQCEHGPYFGYLNTTQELLKALQKKCVLISTWADRQTERAV